MKKATGPDGVSASLLKYVGMAIAPSLTSVFKQSVEACTEATGPVENS